MAKYKWACGYGLKGIKAEEAAAEMERIEAQAGKLTPERVVEAARSDRSPLHSAFEWNDGLAADQYRLQQARKLIQCVVVVLDEAPKNPTRAFVSVTQDEDFGPSYVGVVRAMSDAAMRRQVLGRALNEAKAWAKRYREYEELGEILSAVDRTVRRKTKRRKAA